jgi:hypothetical protein
MLPREAVPHADGSELLSGQCVVTRSAKSLSGTRSTDRQWTIALR